MVPTTAVLIALTSSVGAGVAPILQPVSNSETVNKGEMVFCKNFRINMWVPLSKMVKILKFDTFMFLNIIIRHVVYKL